MESTITTKPTTLDQILELLKDTAQLAALASSPLGPEVTAVANIAAASLSIVQKALAIHEAALTGVLDLSKLHTIDPAV
jgi:hypothetical protein